MEILTKKLAKACCGLNKLDHCMSCVIPFGQVSFIGYHCKDDRTAGRTKGVRHTSPGPSKGRGEARYFAPKGTQGKGGVRRKSRTEG